MKKQDCFYLGKIIKKYSFNGKVLVKIDSDNSEKYSNLKNVFVENDKVLIPFFIKKIKLHKPNIYRIQFEDINSEELANKILKKEIYLPLSSLPKLKGKKFYFHEVIGFKAINNNNIIGIVEKINDQSPQAIFEIRNPDKLILVPIHNKFIIRINRKEKKIELNIPDGLLDLQD